MGWTFFSSPKHPDWFRGPTQLPTQWMSGDLFKKKKKVKQSRYRPAVAQWVPEVKVPRFRDNGTGWW